MTHRGRTRRRNLASVALATLSAVVIAADITIPVTLEFEIHPNLAAEHCARLPSAGEISQEEAFPELLARGWVTLKGYTFDAGREFYPCMQDVRVEFPTEQLYHEFVRTMSACPQYPFYSGADYTLETRIFERTANSADATAYLNLLAKDGRCASELNPLLYSILRRNPTAFLKAFSELPPSQQEIAAATQYDFNLELRDQQFSPRAISSLPERFRAGATKYNDLLARVAR